jgi:hypothetical protein
VHTRTVSAASTASSRVVASSDRLAANCAADRRSELLASWRARPRHRGQHRAAAAVLRAVRELSTAGSAHTVRCSTRMPAGSGSTRRRAACTLLHLRVDGTIQRCAAARGSAADGEFVCRGFDVGLVGRPSSIDPDRSGSLECDGEPCCTSACGLSHSGRASAGQPRAERRGRRQRLRRCTGWLQQHWYLPCGKRRSVHSAGGRVDWVSAALTGGCRAQFARADWRAASTQTGREAVRQGGRVAVALRRVASRVLGRVSAPGAVVEQWMQDTQRSNAERSWRLSLSSGK